jgi:hypothetical protein
VGAVMLCKLGECLLNGLHTGDSRLEAVILCYFSVLCVGDDKRCAFRRRSKIKENRFRNINNISFILNTVSSRHSRRTILYTLDTTNRFNLLSSSTVNSK